MIFFVRRLALYTAQISNFIINFNDVRNSLIFSIKVGSEFEERYWRDSNTQTLVFKSLQDIHSTTCQCLLNIISPFYQEQDFTILKILEPTRRFGVVLCHEIGLA